MKIAKKDCENNQGRNIENYQTKKKRKERIWKK